MMIKLTIHTATYNRAYILPQAYESLKAQTCKDFEWIITDDGSTDETSQLVEMWQMENNDFPIIYNKLSHVGIPRALNSGVNKANANWFMMLDSDDYILPETVQKVSDWIDEIKDDNSFAGIGFAKCFPNGEYMRNQSPIIDPGLGYVDASNVDRIKYNLNMDMAEVYRVIHMKKHPFLVWEDEYYAPEQIAFNNMSLDGLKIRWRCDKLYICDYLPDGQTRDTGLVKRNPMGFAMMHNQNMLIHKRFIAKCRSAIQMTALCLYAGHPSYLKKSNCFAATILTFPIGVLVSIRRKKQFSE